MNGKLKPSGKRRSASKRNACRNVPRTVSVRGIYCEVLGAVRESEAREIAHQVASGQVKAIDLADARLLQS